MPANNAADAAWLGLTGRVCAVTGAASGIGAEAARLFAAAGASVAVLDRDGEGARRTAGEIERAGHRAIGIATDVSRPDQVQAAADQAQRELGPCSVLVNCAAVLNPGPLMELPIEKWNASMAVNLTGVLVCAQAFGRQMIAAGRGGSMIHVGSIAGESPRTNGGAYSPSKAGLSMLSQQLTVELGPHRIRSNVVSPALVRTPLSEVAYSNPDFLAKRVSMVPSGRIALAVDIANTILFLASDKGEYINGQTILVDGGFNQVLMSLVPRPG